MLVTFVVFAVSFILGIIGPLIYLAPKSKANMSTVPGLNASDETLGNLDDITAAGSFHQFLSQLHEKFGPIASFWYGPQYCVSVCNAQGFKDIQYLTDRPGMFLFTCGGEDHSNNAG